MLVGTYVSDESSLNSFVGFGGFNTERMYQKNREKWAKRVSETTGVAAARSSASGEGSHCRR